jgi:hypothetical protein
MAAVYGRDAGSLASIRTPERRWPPCPCPLGC